MKAPPQPLALVVDADEKFVIGATAVLRERGFSVRAAETGGAARRIARSEDFSVAVVSSVLPDDDGSSLCRELRAVRPESAIIVVSDQAELLAPGDRGSLVADDIFVRTNDLSELGWRAQARADAMRTLVDLRQREHFLRAVVRLADAISPHQDLPAVTSSLAPALLGMPGVEGARIELSPDAPGDPVLVVLEAGSLSGIANRQAESIPLRGGASGRLVLATNNDARLDGELKGMLGTLVGAAVTAARQFAALKERQLRLERGYVDRHRKLSRVGARLERLSDARDSFLALLSHDLRSPLAVVLGQVQLLEEGLIGAPQIPKVAATVRRQSERMVQMVEGLLDRYRRDSAVGAVPESGDASRITADMVENLRPLAAARRQTIALTTPADAPIDADIASIREVLANLMENAVRHSPEGATVRVDVVAAEGKVQITIRDQGSGFGGRPAEGGSGLGLGLRASARIVADAGGQLRTANIPGGGGLAVVTLPLALPRAAASAIEVYSSDDAFAEQLRGLLAKHWECVVFDSIGGALDRMRRNPPAVVLLDSAISDDVVAFVRRVKSDAEMAAVPVLAFGGESGDLYDAGALAVLRREIDGPRVVANVRRALHLLGEAAGQDPRLPPDVLTGLPTAAALTARLDTALTHARTSGTALPVVILRLDDLREINRQHGWLVGDQLLLWITGRLQERVRADEIAARVDAETFALAVPGRSLDEAQGLAAELVESIARARPRLGVARVDVRVSAQALDLATLALGDRTLDGGARGGGG